MEDLTQYVKDFGNKYLKLVKDLMPQYVKHLKKMADYFDTEFILVYDHPFNIRYFAQLDRHPTGLEKFEYIRSNDNLLGGQAFVRISYYQYYSQYTPFPSRRGEDNIILAELGQLGDIEDALRYHDYDFMKLFVSGTTYSNNDRVWDLAIRVVRRTNLAIAGVVNRYKVVK